MLRAVLVVASLAVAAAMMGPDVEMRIDVTTPGSPKQLEVYAKATGTLEEADVVGHNLAPVGIRCELTAIPGGRSAQTGHRPPPFGWQRRSRAASSCTARRPRASSPWSSAEGARLWTRSGTRRPRARAP